MTIELRRFRYPIPSRGNGRVLLEPLALLTASREDLKPGVHNIVFEGLPSYQADVKSSGTAVMKRGVNEQKVLDNLAEILGEERGPNVTDVLRLVDQDTPNITFESTLNGKPHKVHGAILYKK